MEFKRANNIIRKYIKTTLDLPQIKQFIPNSHIAEVFKDVLIYIELESRFPESYHFIKHNPLTTLHSTTDPSLYDKTDEGYVLKETYSVGAIHLIPEYFDTRRLKDNPAEEIHEVYQRLRDKKDELRNLIKLGRIVTPASVNHQPLAKSYKLKIK